MKILMISDPSNPHTQRWANALTKDGYKVFVYGLDKYDAAEYLPEISVNYLDSSPKLKNISPTDLKKILYIKALSELKRIVKEFQPSLVHAHYISSNGFLAALLNFHPLILTVWGSDIVRFPKKSMINKTIIKFILNRSDKILVASKYLQSVTSIYTRKIPEIIPFSIDTNQFKVQKIKPNNDPILIGTVKPLEFRYGIDVLLDVYALVLKSTKAATRLVIIGDGAERTNLILRCQKLGINNYVEFTGKIPQSQIVEYHMKLDIEVYMSRVEGFGVSILEAISCGNAVVASNVGGIPEIISNNVTGILVESENVNKTAAAIIALVENPELRKTLGSRGRAMVLDKFDIHDAIRKLSSVYREYARD